MNIAGARVAARACRRAIWSVRPNGVDLASHLAAVYHWLCTAQDATPDGGVSGTYNLVRGWAGSYPETTGYIIPTFLHYAVASEAPDARQRALRMADWEIDVQLTSGAVRSGMRGTKIGPAVFNTGQVLFGWVSAFQATDDERYARAAAKAVRWLMSVQDADGAWRKHLSTLTTSSVQTYNTRTAWGLAQAGVEWNERRWTAAATRNCDWAVSQQQPNGWFAHNAFSDTEKPLLHTIGYVLEGLLAVGELLNRDDYIQATVAGMRPLMESFGRTRGLFGRYDDQWRATVSWRCLTGEAQIAIVLDRLAAITGDSAYSAMAQSLVESIARLQDMSPQHPESFGSVPGSEPLWGGYGPFNYLNWAAKFYMDALLLRLRRVDVQRSLRGGAPNVSYQIAS